MAWLRLRIKLLLRGDALAQRLVLARSLAVRHGGNDD